VDESLRAFGAAFMTAQNRTVDQLLLFARTVASETTVLLSPLPYKGDTRSPAVSLARQRAFLPPPSPVSDVVRSRPRPCTMATAWAERLGRCV